MTREEAIECINAIHVQMFNSGNSKWTEACDMAIEALKICEECVWFKERPHGEWTEEFDESANPFFQRRWRCSACNDYNYYGRPDFCPCCGADMREGEEE